jgi:hypothetical protein
VDQEEEDRVDHDECEDESLHASHDRRRRPFGRKKSSAGGNGAGAAESRRYADTVVMAFTHRIATTDDLESLEAVMDAAVSELQKQFLSPEEIESSRAIMGIDTQLIKDGTYYVVFDGNVVAGCGGWSRRATMYGGDHTPGVIRNFSTRPSMRRECVPCTPTLPTPVAAWGG